MNEDIEAYARFFGASSSSLSSSELVPLSFSVFQESSPATLAVFSDRLRDDLPKTAFSKCWTSSGLENAERRVISIQGYIPTPHLTHTQLFS